MARNKVLVVEDDRAVREGLLRALRGAGHDVLAAPTLAEARKILAEGPVDVVLLDVRLPDGDGLGLLGDLRREHPNLPVIMATAYGDSDRTIAAMSAGAFEYLTKPFDFDLLLSTVARAGRAARPIEQVSTEASVAPTMVGRSAPMLEVWKAIGRAAASDVPVLITGESGTGKELVARAIHQHGPRRGRPFVAVNLAALPESLLESELFGHEKGAFTGAQARREGRFESSADGTLFLDEIGDLPVALQTKLLRVLQDGSFERVGGQGPLRSRARVVAATSRPVAPDEPGTTLREDLYYRLAVVRINVPPLRERAADVPLLVEAHLRGQRSVSEVGMAKLMAHRWPGNVRELLHVLDRACVMTPSTMLDASDLVLGPVHGRGAGGATAAAGPSSASADRTPSEVDEADDLDLHAAVTSLERRYIQRALERSRGNRAEAARLLGIGRGQLYAKMKELGFETVKDRG